MQSIAYAISNADIERCFPVMAELRPHLKESEFVDRVRRLEASGYRLIFLENDGTVKSVAGVRVSENLAWGKFLYVDDLVTRDSDGGQGFGGALLDWLFERAKAEGCQQFHLDSGVHRFEAHRFYFKKRMAITCHHFALKLE